jgi:hypothetical protein
MNITRKSPLTGKTTTMDLPVTEEQMAEFERPRRRFVQDIFPNLTDAEREFIKTGYTQADWNAMFPEEAPE